jgi:hypothetical protein
MMFEDEMYKALEEFVIDNPGMDFYRNTRSVSLPDFKISGPLFQAMIEVKEKNGPYSGKNWGISQRQEQAVFILDELTVRKLIYHSPGAFLVIKDNTVHGKPYYLYSVTDLACMPKKRFNRPMQNGLLKGKWMIQWAHGMRLDNLRDVLNRIEHECMHMDNMLFQSLPCHGRADVTLAGIPRTAEHKKSDMEASYSG